MGGEITGVSGGMDTRRLSASEREQQYREERRQVATGYLRRKGSDLLSVLGLDQPAEPAAAFADVPEPDALVPAGRRAPRKARP